MTKTITLDGGKEIRLAANAATPFRFKQLFNKDLLKLFQDNSEDEKNHVYMADVMAELAFIMNQQAEKADMNSLSMDAFYLWLEDFEAMDFVTKADVIVNVYLASTQMSVEAKKKQK